MSIYVQDTFTGTNGTNLTSHTPDVGGAWMIGTGIKIQSNRIRCDNFAGNRTYNAATPSSANYDVSADVFFFGAGPPTGNRVGVAGRINDVSSNDYLAYYDGDAAGWKLVKTLSSVETQLGSTYAMAYVQNQTHTVGLRCKGSVITMFVDGAPRVSVVDTGITAKGNGGVDMQDVAAQCLDIDNFLMNDIMGPSFRDVRLRQYPFKPCGDGFRGGKYQSWR